MKQITWRSYSILIVSILLISNILLLDLLAPYLNEFTGTLYYLFVPVSLVAMIMLLIISFRSKEENKIMPIIALNLTFISLVMIAFFFYFGVHFAS
ncbi:hypothetical protein [Alkalicoccobacillus murimartini]|uniref:Phosphoglycerol transferase MdoB-like AlkP superfamily enzyme n=1 Tax=Alkalicoccobacillus murimartini TaxID=171685 RepID=A0ABT9YIH5_9BACI|nr:hypothetical protein [Alkalicoccobacillus murimartini]MDQ0207506.1 phosphoglycerol transferase MdoB-like AlkP superfamily enzyme [Alkalicoccobacillus murimartini]